MDFVQLKRKLALTSAIALTIASFGFSSVAKAEDDAKTSGPARIDVNGTVPLETINGKGDVKMTHAGWEKDETKKAKFLTSPSMLAQTDEWTQYQLSFKALEDGTVRLILRGQWNKTKKNWVFFDNFTIEGASMVNSDFEKVDPNGLPSGWYLPLSIAQYVIDPEISQSGKAFVRCWHDRPAVQNIKVKANQKVTVNFWVKYEKEEDR